MKDWYHNADQGRNPAGSAIVFGRDGQFVSIVMVRFRVSNQGHDLRLVSPSYDRLRTGAVSGVVKFTLEAERLAHNHSRGL